MKSLAIALLLTLPLPAFTQPNRIVCSRVKVSDGDTITCDNLKIRFCGIDAPEKQQPLGLDSKQKLKELLKNKSVSIAPVAIDRFNRTVAEIWVRGSHRTVNAQMVRIGMAYHFSRYSDQCPNRQQIVDSERRAQLDRVGVWRGAYEKPWNFRRRMRTR